MIHFSHKPLSCHILRALTGFLLISIATLFLIPTTTLAQPQSTDEINCPSEKNTKDNCWIAWSADGQWIATAGGNAIGVDIWETNSGELVRHLETSVHVFAWNPLIEHSNLLMTVTSLDYSIRIWDIETGDEIHSHIFEPLLFDEIDKGNLPNFPDILTSISWNTTTNQIVVCAHLWCGVWDLESDEMVPINETDGYQKPFAAAWSPDDEYLALAGEKVYIYEAGSLKLVHMFDLLHFMNAYRGLQSIDWSPDGKHIITEAVAIPNGIIRLYDVETGDVQIIDSHTSPMNAVAWSPDGAYIASAGGDDFIGYPADNAIRIWNAETFELVREIEYDESIMSISWKPDGSQIAAVDADGVVYFVDIE